MKKYAHLSAEQPNLYYYAFEEKIPLFTIANKYVIRIRTLSDAEPKLRTFDLLDGIQQLSWLDNRTAVVQIEESVSPSVIRQRGLETDEIYTVQPLYSLDTGLEMPVADEFVIGFSASNQQEIEAMHGNFRITILETNEVFQLLRVPKGGNALEIANLYQESGLVKFSHPNFIVTPQRFQPAPNDPYFVNQFYLNNTGQVFNPVENHAGTPGADINIIEAWNVTSGSSAIIVAVLDDGVTSDHPDLPNTRQVRLNGSNFAGGNVDDPSPTGQSNHGNACSGLIAATKDNGEGIAGIAPDVRIMPIRVIGADPAGTAAAILFAVSNQAHILSCSWGYDSQNPNFLPVIVNAIQQAVTNGRNGLGSVVVFAAGNNARHSLGINGVVQFPANVNVGGVITVGASDRNDQQADYSPTSNVLSADNQIIDIVAPSHRAYPANLGGIPGETFEIWSIDVPGATGYNPWPNISNQIVPPTIGEQLPSSGVNFQSYTGRFGGTSAACPQVAGVAALVLSLNNNLSQFQVFDIITGSAEKVGGYTYDVNGWSTELGFGRLNAFAALNRIPGRFNLSGSNSLCSSSNYTVTGLPSGSVVTWSSSADYIATISPSGVATKVDDGDVTFTATINIPNRGGTIVLTKFVTVGTMSPWVGATFNDGGSGVNQPITSTFNEVFHRTVYISLWGSPSEFTWSNFYANGNTTWYHPTGPEGLVINFGDPLPVFPGDYLDFSIQRTNACGVRNEPNFFYYNGPTEWFSVLYSAMDSSITITQSESGNKSRENFEVEENVVLQKVLVIDTTGKTVVEDTYSKGSKSATIDAGELTPGTYLVRVFTKNHVESFQIVV